jgi:hypothetical protein
MDILAILGSLVCMSVNEFPISPDNIGHMIIWYLDRKVEAR